MKRFRDLEVANGGRNRNGYVADEECYHNLLVAVIRNEVEDATRGIGKITLNKDGKFNSATLAKVRRKKDSIEFLFGQGLDTLLDVYSQWGLEINAEVIRRGVRMRWKKEWYKEEEVSDGEICCGADGTYGFDGDGVE